MSGVLDGDNGTFSHSSRGFDEDGGESFDDERCTSVAEPEHDDVHGPTFGERHHFTKVEIERQENATLSL